MKKIAIILILLLTMGSCIKQSLQGHNAQVFKFKEGHYRPDNAYVILTRDKAIISPKSQRGKKMVADGGTKMDLGHLKKWVENLLLPKYLLENSV